MTRKDIEQRGWIFQREYTRMESFEADYPTKQEFQIGDIWRGNGQGGFLTFWPETSDISIITTDPEFNQDGPNISQKFKGRCVDPLLFDLILHAINSKI